MAATPSDVVRRWWAARAAGDEPASRALLSVDLEWTVVGRHASVARTYRGPDAFFGELVAGNVEVFEPGSARTVIRGLYEDALQDTVVTHLHKTARTRNGLDFQNDIVTIMTVRGGLIGSCLEFMDLHEVRRTFGE